MGIHASVLCYGKSHDITRAILYRGMVCYTDIRYTSHMMCNTIVFDIVVSLM